MRVIAPAATSVVATEFRAGGGDHPAGASIPAERVAAAATALGIPADVVRSPSSAARLVAERTAAAVPVVVSGSFHLLAAMRPGTTTR